MRWQDLGQFYSYLKHLLDTKWGYYLPQFYLEYPLGQELQVTWEDVVAWYGLNLNDYGEDVRATWHAPPA